MGLRWRAVEAGGAAHARASRPLPLARRRAGAAAFLSAGTGLRREDGADAPPPLVPALAPGRALARRTSTTSTTDPPSGRSLAEERHRKFEMVEDSAERRALTQSRVSRNAVRRALAGNCVISGLKLAMFLQTGSSAMLAETVHSLADAGNQALLLKGQADASRTPDKKFPYGYGKAGFFWGLVSAVGMFWLGAGLTVGHAAYQLLHPPELFEVSREMLWVLGASFLVDGWVLASALHEVNKTKPKHVGLLAHLNSDGVRDPYLLGVLFEDAAACAGVVVAATGAYLTMKHADVSYDTLACLGVGLLLGGVAIKLASINQRYLLGMSVDDDIVSDIKRVIAGRPAIHAVKDVQSQWIAPSAFMFKAECDFDGFVLAQRLRDYVPLFQHAVGTDAARGPYASDDLRTVMHWYAEDITRLIELEIKEIEMVIRAKYPEAAFIEIEPDSRKTFERKSDGGARATSFDELKALEQLSADLDTVSQHLQRKMSLGGRERDAEDAAEGDAADAGGRRA